MSCFSIKGGIMFWNTNDQAENCETLHGTQTVLVKQSKTKNIDCKQGCYETKQRSLIRNGSIKYDVMKMG